jgi:hypothetical protein
MYCVSEPHTLEALNQQPITATYDDWVQVGAQEVKYEGAGNHHVGTSVFARCIQEGDGSEYGFVSNDGTNSNSVYIVEWEVVA